MAMRSKAAWVWAALALGSAGCSHQTSTTAASQAQVVARDEKLAARLHEVLHRHDETGAVVGVRVIDLASGRELFAENPDRPMMPASNMKLLTTSATLDRFGAGHKFETYLAKDGEDLWVIGTGDPSLGDPKIAKKRGELPTAVFQRWAEALKAKGVTEFKGKLYYYDAAFDAQTVHPSWSKGYLTDWYAAPVTGLNFNDNCIDVTVTPGAKNGDPVTYEVMPPVKNITMENKMVTGGKEEAEPVDRKNDGSMNWFLVGGVKEKKTLGSKCVPDPGAFFADAMRTNFDANGIRIAGPTERAEKPLGGTLAPPAEKVLLVEMSTMPVVLNRLNKDSQNLFAEAFSKTLGRQYDADRGEEKPGSWKSGGEAVHAFLKKNGIDDSKVVTTDGSGLSRDNRVTARVMSDLLVVMAKHRDASTFRDSLPVGGVDGTIGKRLKDIPGRVQAKTGFIGGVRALSGYAKTDEGKTLVFSILYNEFKGSVKPFEEMQDDACRVLVKWPNVERAKLAPSTQPK
jgi:D-alanyl-D-alanine carboxypeptidase/D-alanyl-D-alanine-endopeptidase (penicillin-binding protein 4)